MMRSLFTAIILAASTSTLAQQAPAPLPQVPGAITSLQNEALDDRLAWTIAEDLTTEVGQRLAGTEAEARARA